MPELLRSSAVHAITIIAGSLSFDAMEHAIELGKRLKSGFKRGFAHARMGIEEQPLYGLHSYSREVVRERQSCGFFENLAEVEGTHVRGACDLIERQIL